MRLNYYSLFILAFIIIAIGFIVTSSNYLTPYQNTLVSVGTAMVGWLLIIIAFTIGVNS